MRRERARDFLARSSLEAEAPGETAAVIGKLQGTLQLGERCSRWSGDPGHRGTVEPGFSSSFLVHKDESAAALDHGGQRLMYFGRDDTTDELVHALDCQFRGQLFPVRTRGREGIVHFGGTDQSGSPGNRLAGEPIGVTGTVPALVMASHEGAYPAQVWQW